MPPHPSTRIAALLLLPDCDLACVFCGSDAGYAVMSFAQAARLLDRLRAQGVGRLILGGGEPYLWPPGVERLARRARGQGFHVQVCTNGARLPEGFERCESVDRYILPLEAADAALHDRLRRSATGHHAVVTGRIAALAGSGKSLTVSTVVTRENRAELPRIRDYLARARDSGVALHAWHLYRFLPVGRGGSVHARRLSIDREAFVEACRAVRRPEPGFRIYRRSNMLRSRRVAYYWYEDGELRAGGAAIPLPAPAARGAG